MTVDELVEALKAISEAGHGDADVRIYSELSSNYDGYEPISSAKFVESESNGQYARID